MKSLTKFILFILSISYVLTGAIDAGDACNNNACTDTNAECKSNLCKCKSGYYKKILLVLQILL